jgi:hypothetical protein
MKAAPARIAPAVDGCRIGRRFAVLAPGMTGMAAPAPSVCTVVAAVVAVSSTALIAFEASVVAAVAFSTHLFAGGGRGKTMSRHRHLEL